MYQNKKNTPKPSSRLDGKKYSAFSKAISEGWRAYMLSMQQNGNCLDLSHGNPLFGPPTSIKKALHNLAERTACFDPEHTATAIAEDSIDLRGYRWEQLTQPDLERAAMAEFKRLGILVKETLNPLTGSRNIIAANGITQLFALAILSMVDEGGKVLFLTPTYSLFQYSIEALDQSIKTILLEGSPENDYKITAPALRETLIKHPDMSCIVLVNPGNPTGAVYSKEEYTALANVLIDYPHIWVIEDCIYDKIFLDKNVAKTFIPFGAITVANNNMHSRTLTIKGFSKADGMPKLRLAYATIDHNVLAHRIRRIIFSTTFAASEVVQCIGSVVLRDTPASYYEAISAKYRELRDFVYERVIEINHQLNLLFGSNNIQYISSNKPSTGFFILLFFEGLRGFALSKYEMLKNGCQLSEFFIRDGYVHLINGEAHGFSAHHLALRLTFSSEKSLLHQGMLRIERSLKHLANSQLGKSHQHMKIIITFQPGYGHLQPIIGLTRTLIAEGHEVTLVTSPSFAKVVQEKGMICLGAGPAWDLSNLTKMFPELASIELSERSIPLMKLILTQITAQFVMDLLPIVTAIKPDLIITDHTEFAGRLAAEYCHVPALVIAAGLRFPAELFTHFFGNDLNQLRAQFSLSGSASHKNIYSSSIVNFLPPPCFIGPGYALLEQDYFFQPEETDIIGDTSQLQSILKAFPPGQPLVHASLGTILDNESAVIRKIITAFQNKPCNLLITVNPTTDITKEYGQLPSNIRVSPYIPHSALLPKCHVMITHGGFNSIVSGIMHDLPLLILPMTADEATLMTAIVNLRCGTTIKEALTKNSYGELFIDPSKLTSEDIYRRTMHLISNSSFKKNTSTLRRRMHSQPHLDQVAPLLVKTISHARQLCSFRIQLQDHLYFNDLYILRIRLLNILAVALETKQYDVLLYQAIMAIPESEVSYTDIIKMLICFLMMTPSLQIHSQHMLKITDIFSDLLITEKNEFDEEQLTGILIVQNNQLQTGDQFKPRLKAIMDEQGGDAQHTNFIVGENFLKKSAVPFSSYTRQSNTTRLNPYFYPSTLQHRDHVYSITSSSEIALIVPVKNNQDGVNRLLSSLFSKTEKNNYPRTIIIVDNNSKEPVVIPTRYTQFGVEIICISCTQPGPAAARNMGASIASSKGAEWLLFVDSDCLITETTISGYIGLSGKAVAYQGKIEINQRDWLSNFYRQWIDIFFTKTAENTRLTYLITANIIVNSQVFNAIGGFDVIFSQAGGEDFDLAARLARHFLIQLAPNSQVEHHYVTDDNNHSTVFNQHLLEFIDRYERYGKWNELIHLKYGEFAISHNSRDLLRNLAFWLYAKLTTNQFHEKMKTLMLSADQQAISHANDDLFLLMMQAMQHGIMEYHSKLSIPDSDTIQFIDKVKSKKYLKINGSLVAQARQSLKCEPHSPGPMAEINKIENRTIDNNISVRIYTPKGQGPFPVLMWFHGGGWVLGDLDNADGTARRLCVQAHCIVISVDYRLAPEVKFPGAFDDCYTATIWAYENATVMNANKNKIAVGGDSAGGNLAANVALKIRDLGSIPLIYQLLICPVMDRDFETPSYKRYAEGYLLTRNSMRWFWEQYTSPETSTNTPYLAPLHANNVSNVAPACIITAEFDVLHDEGRDYAERLKKEKVKTFYLDYK